MAACPPRIPDRATPWGCLAANLALPGLGTFISGARVTGLLQMVLSQTGFALTLIWTIWTTETGLRTGTWTVQPDRLLWLGLGGALLFLGMLAWALLSSFQWMRRSRSQPPR